MFALIVPLMRITTFIRELEVGLSSLPPVLTTVIAYHKFTITIMKLTFIHTREWTNRVFLKASEMALHDPGLAYPD